jgi:hypothetical protein
MLETWDEDPALARRGKATVAIGLDFALIAAYVALFSFLCLLAAARLSRGRLRTLGLVAAAGLVVAGFADVVENTALLMMLYAAVETPWPQTAQAASIIKFGLIALGLVYASFVWAKTTAAEVVPALRNV